MIKKVFPFILVLAFISGSVNSQTPAKGTKAKTEQKKQETKASVSAPAAKPDAGDVVITGKKGPDGQSVYQGIKGGQYYFNKNGNKTYLKADDNVVAGKKGPQGQTVFKGPQGGEYYMDKNGKKTYLKK